MNLSRVSSGSLDIRPITPDDSPGALNSAAPGPSGTAPIGSQLREHEKATRDALLARLAGQPPVPERGHRPRLPTSHAKQWCALKDRLKAALIGVQWDAFVNAVSVDEAYRKHAGQLNQIIQNVLPEQAWLLEKANSYISKKLAQQLFLRAERGAVFPSKGMKNMNGDVVRAEDGRLFQIQKKMTSELRQRIESEQGQKIKERSTAAKLTRKLLSLSQRPTYKGGGTTLGSGDYGLVEIADHLTDETGRRLVACKTFGHAPDGEKEYGIVQMLPQSEHFTTTRAFASYGRLAHIFSDLQVHGDLAKVMKSIRSDKQLWGDATLVRTLAKGCVQAVHALHARAIYQQDVKPDNFLISKDGVPVLTDFGVASTDNNVLKAGTDGYIAPESWKPGSTKLEGDKYALGATLMTLIPPQSRNVPDRWTELRLIATRLMDADPKKRPNLDSVLALPYFEAQTYSKDNLTTILNRL